MYVDYIMASKDHSDVADVCVFWPSLYLDLIFTDYQS